jgi:DNA-binding GntR family transcriptional regulator
VTAALPARAAPAYGFGRVQLSEEVAGHLRDEIMSGALRPGEFIRLEAVAQRLGTSVTPVREALLLLRGEDMVRLLPRRGFVVSPLSRVDVEDLFAVQADLAGELAARAAARITDEQVAALDALNDRLLQALGSGDSDRIEVLEYQFHRALNLCAESRKLGYVLRSASQYLPRHFYSGDTRWRRAVRRDHGRLLAAARERDPDAARDAIRAHVLDGRERLLEHLDEIGFWNVAAH